MICFQWIEPCRSERLKAAQEKLLESIHALGLEPVLYPAGPEMVKFVDILRFARERAKGGSFVWETQSKLKVWDSIWIKIMNHRDYPCRLDIHYL